MMDLSEHLFDVGATMARAQAEMAVTAYGGEVERHNDPMWCPDEVKASLLRYVEHRVPTGGFLQAVLENDLKGAVNGADGTNIRHIPGIVAFCWDEIPAGCWGSRAKVTEWLAYKTRDNRGEV